MTLKPLLGQKQRAAQRFHVVRTLLFVVLMLCAPFTRAAQEGAVPAYKVKSAFLYNFAKFIQWPPKAFATPDAPFVIGVIGHNPFGEYLDLLKERKIEGHEIQIQQFDSAEEALKGHCHVLFIGDRKRAAKIVSELQNEKADVLTVTDEVDTDSFQSSGAVINLVTTASRTVHFEINVDAARRAELKINSSLLNLAKIVRDGRA